jgi:hypothetical protein
MMVVIPVLAKSGTFTVTSLSVIDTISAGWPLKVKIALSLYSANPETLIFTCVPGAPNSGLGFWVLSNLIPKAGLPSP